MVGLGFGIAIVNDNVAVGRGLAVLPLPMLPTVDYHAFWLPTSPRLNRIETVVEVIALANQQAVA